MSGDQPAEFHLLEQSLGYFYSAALRAAARLDLAEPLAEAARTPEELAEAVGADGPSVHRLLRLLATRGVFAEDDTGRFHLTPSADLLRTDAPGSMKSAVLMLTDQVFWKPAELLDDTVRAGQTQFGQVFPAPFFEWLARDEQAGDAFHVGMAAQSDAENRRIADSYDFSRIGELVDVGGGHGGFLVEVLRKAPNLRGVLFDEEHVLAQHRLGEARAADRSDALSGDFFREVPSGADAYVLKRILHDWDDEASTRILSRCREVVAPDGRVLVIDAVIPPGNEPHPRKDPGHAAHDVVAGQGAHRGGVRAGVRRCGTVGDASDPHRHTAVDRGRRRRVVRHVTGRPDDRASRSRPGAPDHGGNGPAFLLVAAPGIVPFGQALDDPHFPNIAAEQVPRRGHSGSRAQRGRLPVPVGVKRLGGLRSTRRIDRSSPHATGPPAAQIVRRRASPFDHDTNMIMHDVRFFIRSAQRNTRTAKLSTVA